MSWKMNQKEKVMGLAYVFLLFAAITTACCLLLFYYNSDFLAYSQKKHIAVDKMDMINDYRNTQSHALWTVDSLFSKINRYQPMVTAVYEENDIEFMINELKNIYEQHAWDVRYKSFAHVSAFYSAWFTDKKVLWTKRDNITRFKQNLEECEIGLKNNKDNLLLSSKK